MKTRTIAAAAALAATAATGAGLAPHASAAATAPTARTCQAFRAWEHHKATASLVTVYRLSRHASEPVRTDVTVVYAEAGQNDWFDLPADTRFLALDCRHARLGGRLSGRASQRRA